MEPAEGRSAPEMQLNSVVLPEPLGPMSPRISPSRTSIETSWRAVKPPKRLVRRETVSMARGGGRGARPRAPARPGRSAAGGPRRGRRERQARRWGGYRLGEHHLELSLVHLEHHRERALILAAHRVALGEELHAVAHHGAPLGDVGLAGRLRERVRPEAAVLLDGAGEDVVQED